MIRFTFLHLIVSLSLGLPVLGQKIHPDTAKTTGVTAQQVCSFITGRMAAALPQVPTLCSDETKVAGYLDIYVNSPTNVLEGNMRRAWSSALFQTLEAMPEDPLLKSACFEKLICDLTISDSFMAQHALHYRMFSISRMTNMVHAEQGTPLSETWYLSWWEALLLGKEAEHPQSAENATEVGKSACEEYVRKTGPRFRAFDKPVPTCSVMLATDKKLYIVLDTDLLEAFSSNITDLSESIGKSLDDTGYDGEVIVRSPWFATKLGDERAYRMYPLRNLEFAYEEVQSGLRKPAEADFMITMHYMGSGQTHADHLQLPDSKETEFRTAGVVRVVSDAGANALLYTSDGAEWRAPTQALGHCGVAVGSELEILLVPGLKPSLSTTGLDAHDCKIEAEFVRGW